MKAPYEIEIVRKVYENDTGCALSVGPCPDCPGNVQIHAASKEDKDYFSDVRFSVPAAYAMLLGQALVAAGNEAMTPPPTGHQKESL